MAAAKAEKEKIEAERQALLNEAKKQKKAIEDVSRKKVRPDGEKIYGSVTASNVAEVISAASGVMVKVSALNMPAKIISVGTFTVSIEVHPDVVAITSMNVVSEGKGGEEDEE